MFPFIRCLYWLCACLLMARYRWWVTIAFIARKRRYKPSRSEPASAERAFSLLTKTIPAFTEFLSALFWHAFWFVYTDRSRRNRVCFVRLLVPFLSIVSLACGPIPLICIETVQGTSSVMFIIIGRWSSGYYMTQQENRPAQCCVCFDRTLITNELLLLLLINVLLLVVGMFIEGGVQRWCLNALICCFRLCLT